MSHTPGPWNFDPDKVAPWDENWVASKYGILARVLGDRDDPEDNANGNAYLIAAAPDLLEALERAVALIAWELKHDVTNKWPNVSGVKQDIEKAARAAIAKAINLKDGTK